MSPLGIGTLLFAALLAGCETSPDEGILEVTFLGALGGAELGGAIAAIEDGGFNLQNPDPTVGAPSYRYGAQAGEHGSFTILLPAGHVGVHMFVDGYYCGAKEILIEPEHFSFQQLEIRAEELPLDQVQRPVASNLRLEPGAVAPGKEFTISAHVSAGSPDDPLSDKIIAVQPELTLAAALDPPSEDDEQGEQGVGPADGTWKRTLLAPDVKGSYTYHLVVATQGCVTSVPQTVTLIVE